MRNQMSCEAERRTLMALYAISIQKGNGEWNLNSIERILAGPPCDCTNQGSDTNHKQAGHYSGETRNG